MSAGSIPNHVIKQLKKLLKGHRDFNFIEFSQGHVLSRYQGVFSPENIPNLKKKEFESFLYYENNCHWTRLERNRSKLLANMKQLKKGLAVLVDEFRPVSERLTQSVKIVHGMGKALATAILHISKPYKYGVWNGKSEDALKALGASSCFKKGSLGDKYERVNKVLLEMCAKLKIDLWTNDALLGVLVEEGILKKDSKKRRG